MALSYRCAGCDRGLEFPGYCGTCAARMRRELNEKAAQRHIEQPFRGHGASYGRSCLPLLLLLVVSVWAVLAFGAQVVQVVTS